MVDGDREPEIAGIVSEIYNTRPVLASEKKKRRQKYAVRDQHQGQHIRQGRGFAPGRCLMGRLIRGRRYFYGPNRVHRIILVDLRLVLTLPPFASVPTESLGRSRFLRGQRREIKGNPGLDSVRSRSGKLEYTQRA